MSEVSDEVAEDTNGDLHAGARTALVLGGSSDIALAIIDALVEDHGLDRVVLAARDADALEPRVTSLRRRTEVTIAEWDVLDTASHVPLVERAAEVLGQIDLVICAVGMLGHHAGLGMSPEAIDEMARTNFAGPAAAMSVAADRLVQQRAAAPSTSAPSTIIVLSSVAAARPRRSNYVYGSSKAGLDAFARGMGDALVGTGVRVLVVRPGFVRSRMTVGLDPAPFATDPAAVGSAVVRALGRRGPDPVVWVPATLSPLFAVFRNAPTALWRRIAADR